MKLWNIAESVPNIQVFMVAMKSWDTCLYLDMVML